MSICGSVVSVAASEGQSSVSVQEIVQPPDVVTKTPEKTPEKTDELSELRKDMNFMKEMLAKLISGPTLLVSQTAPEAPAGVAPEAPVRRPRRQV